MDEQSDNALKLYIQEQRELIKLEYELETLEKQKTQIDEIDLCFILRSKAPPGNPRKWITTLPLPKNLIPPEYLIQTDPTYVNVSDKMIIKFLDCKKNSIEGTVKKIKDGELTAIFKIDWEEDSARHLCSIIFAPNDIVYMRKMQALKKLKYLNNNLKDMLCRKYPTSQKIQKINLNLPRNYNFNRSQKKAIRMAVSNPFSLIQGPPGTGKTHTIGAIAIQALKNEPNKKVLICGTTNVSINSLLEIVGDMVQGEGFEVCWPASSSKDFLTEDDLSKEQKLMTLYKSCHMNSAQSRRFKELREKRDLTEDENNEMESLRSILERQIISNSDVIFSTLDSSGKKSIVDSIDEISTLIVDEATLSVESSMIIPLSLLPDRFILVGDHKQLGPSARFDELKQKNFYYSMFERIIREKSCLKNSIMLNTQYRMHPEISCLPNCLFYDGELIDGVNPEDREISKNFIFQKHFNFINTNGKEEMNGTSYINTDEITQVSKFVNSLVDSGVKPSQIGVISAYGAQTHLLSEHFRFYGPRVKVSTIDSFQGSQKDYIIICTSRNGSDIGFLRDERRMNVAITRARCLVAIFGNEMTLSQSCFWSAIIEYAKEQDSFYSRLPIKIEKQKVKTLIISKNNNNIVRDLVYEFKENENEAGYNSREIKSEISDSIIRVLWPDEEDDVQFLKEWVNERVKILDDGYNVTLAYDAEGVCMQFGDIFDKNIDYYNWEPSESSIPEINTNKSIIISFYQHKGNYELDPILVETMKPLLEHPNVTFITFDFTFDIDKLFDFGVNLKTKRIIDSQLMIQPEQSGLNENKDLICSTGWKSIPEFVKQAMEDNDNANIIARAKENVRKGKKKFPHEENHFLISQFNYPHICKFTNLFLEYSAGDIFYTAIAGVDVLSRGELDFVKEQSSKKFEEYLKYRNKYKRAQNVRQAYYVRESFSSAIQAQFSKDSQTYQILSYYKKLDIFVKLFDECPELLSKIIPNFNDEDKTKIQQRYALIIEIMKNPQNIHLGNIKDKAYLAYVHGIQKKGAFVMRVKEKIDEVHDELKNENKAIEEKKETERKEIQKITGGKNSFKSKSDFLAWTKLIISKHVEIKDENRKSFIKSCVNLGMPKHAEIKSENKKQVNKVWANLDMSKLTKSSNEKNKSINKQTNMKKQVNLNKQGIKSVKPEISKNISNHNSTSQYKIQNAETCRISEKEFPIQQEMHALPRKKFNQAWANLDISKPTAQTNEESKYISHQVNHKKQSKDVKNISNYNSALQQNKKYNVQNPKALMISKDELPIQQEIHSPLKKSINQAWANLSISIPTKVDNKPISSILNNKTTPQQEFTVKINNTSNTEWLNFTQMQEKNQVKKSQ